MDYSTKEKNLKACKDCKQEKEYTSEFFVKDNRTSSGLTNQCKECRKKNITKNFRNKGVKKRISFTFGDVIKLTEEINESKVMANMDKETKIKTTDKFTFQCKCGEVFVRNFNKFKDAKQYKCLKCANHEGFKKQAKTTQQFIEELLSIKGDSFELQGEYINYQTKVKIKHKKCNNSFEMLPCQLLSQKQGCPICKESRGENEIRRFLERKNIEFHNQFRFEDCKNIRPLPFDFALFKKEKFLLIEFDGLQHFESSDFFGGEEAFAKRKKNDKIKTEYCKANNLDLLRIPYWELENIENILHKELTSRCIL